MCAGLRIADGDVHISCDPTSDPLGMVKCSNMSYVACKESKSDQKQKNQQMKNEKCRKMKNETHERRGKQTKKRKQRNYGINRNA